MKIVNSVLGCCGYAPSTDGFVRSVFVYGKPEEIDKFFGFADEQDAMFKQEVKSDRFRLKLNNSLEIAAYTLNNSFHPHYKALPVEPRYLQKVDPKVFGYEWLLKGGQAQPNSFVQFVGDPRTSGPISSFVKIEGFGNSPEYYQQKLKSALGYNKPGIIFGLVFSHSESSWVQKAIAELEETKEILVKYQWQNPRYSSDSEEHCLTTIFFKEK